MTSLFGITRDEAIARISRDWQGLDLSSPEDVIYHDDEAYWAKTICFGQDSHWWLPGANPKPRPAP